MFTYTHTHTNTIHSHYSLPQSAAIFQIGVLNCVIMKIQNKITN